MAGAKSLLTELSIRHRFVSCTCLLLFDEWTYLAFALRWLCCKNQARLLPKITSHLLLTKQARYFNSCFSHNIINLCFLFYQQLCESIALIFFLNTVCIPKGRILYEIPVMKYLKQAYLKFCYCSREMWQNPSKTCILHILESLVATCSLKNGFLWSLLDKLLALS